LGDLTMTNTELALAALAVAWLAYAIGYQNAARVKLAAQNQQQADPLAWLGAWGEP
jgi:hypothetical protein